MFLEQGQHQKALPYLEAAAKKQADNHNIYYALGRAQEATGQLRAAHASYTQAVKCRKTKYNLEFKEAQDALKRATERLEAAPPPEVHDTPKDNEGVIESYNESRGFGFISSKTQPRIFFHVSSVVGRQKPRQGERVTFESEITPKGPRAVHVELAKQKEATSNRRGA